MEVFKILNGFDGHAVHFVYHRPSHLRAVIAIDTVVDGRAVGGVRNASYEDEAAAIFEACNLARAMSFKATLADLPCGGAKTVIFKHPKFKRVEGYQVLGQAIEELKGLYHAGSDMGTDASDLAEMARKTRHVSHRLDFGAHTGRGNAAAIRAAVSQTMGLDSLKEVRVAIQGLGDVGMELARNLRSLGARLVVADPDQAKVLQAAEEFDAEVVAPADILREPCDVLAPCANGGVIDSELVPLLACKIICGSANNLLASPQVATELQAAEITHVPDFIASAGALIVGVTQIAHGEDAGRAELVERIFDTTAEILEIASERSISPLQAAETKAAQLMNVAADAL